MKPFLEKIKTNQDSSYKFKKFEGKTYPFHWHFHPEYELTFILKSVGKRFVGDHIGVFQEGDLVLLGSNLPHTWFTEPNHPQDAKDGTESIVFQFSENFLGEAIWQTPEFFSIKNLLEKSNRGLFFPEKVFKKIMPLISDFSEKNSMNRLTIFLDILNILASENDFQFLSSVSFMPQINKIHQNRMDKVFQFTHENFLKESINQKVVANMINMSESNFSHFFKKATSKTFTEYLNELRIGYACKKLIETDETIVNICYQSGFQNVSNFNRQFLSQKQCSPKEFRKEYLQTK